MMKSQPSNISNISDALEENIKKINTIERLSRNLSNELNDEIIYQNYI